MAPEEDSSKSPAPKAFSISLGSSKAKSSPLTRKPLTPSNGIKRPHSSLHDSDDEDDASQTPAEHVSTFDYTAGGAIGINGVKEKAPSLVIPNQKNRDWREESRRKRGRNLLPQEVQQASNVDSEKDVVNGAPQAFGLNFAPKAENGDTTTTGPGEGADRYRLAQEEPVKPKTDDELALEALMSNGEKRRSDMVLPAVMESGDTGRNPAGYGVSEDDAFKADVDSRPEAATLDQYAAVPVEEFGAALLRGMGWKEGDVVGKRKDQISKPRLVEKRPALLGLGAKEVPGGIGEGDELGAWGKASKGKRKVDKTYNPVLLKNQKTGEMVSEEELKGRIEDAKRAEKEEKEDWRDRRDRNLKIDKERKDRRHGDSRERNGDRSERRRRDRDSDYDSSPRPSRDSSPKGGRRRERSRSSDSRHSSRRSRPRDDANGESSSRDRDREKDRRRSRKVYDEDERNGSRSSSTSTKRSHREGSHRSDRGNEKYDNDSGKEDRRRRQEVY